MQTKYNIGDMVYVSDVKESKIYMGTIHEIFIGDDVITYKVSYACYKEKYCHPTFEEARAYLIKYIYAQFQGKLDKVLALKDAEKAN